jgi:hypothetical protein
MGIDPSIVVPWSADWLWSLPVSVITVVIHVLGLFLIRQRFDRVLLHAPRERIRLLSMVFMAAGVWALAFKLLGALPDKKSATLFSLNAMTTFGHSGTTLEGHWMMMGALEALNGWILFGLSTAFLYGMIQEAWVRMAHVRAGLD